MVADSTLLQSDGVSLGASGYLDSFDTSDFTQLVIQYTADDSVHLYLQVSDDDGASWQEIGEIDNVADVNTSEYDVSFSKSRIRYTSGSGTTYGSTQSIFTSQTSTSTGSLDVSLGTLFIPAHDGRVVGIRHYSVGTNAVTGALYSFTNDSSGTQLATVSYTPSSSAWSFGNFSSAVSVTGSKKYVAAVHLSDSYANVSNLFNGAAVTNGDLTAPADDDTGNGHNPRYHVSGLAYPDHFEALYVGGFLIDVLYQKATVVTAELSIHVRGRY